MKKLWILGLSACLMTMAGCGDDGDKGGDNAKGKIGADCSAAADCESGFCSEDGECADVQTEEDKADAECKGKTEGEACGEGKICDKDLKCVTKKGGDEDKADAECKGKTEGEACGEGKICDKDLKCVEEESGDVCADEDICDGRICFVKTDGSAGCSGIFCSNGYNDDGTCKGNIKGGEGIACVDSNDCMPELSCYGGVCTSADGDDDKADAECKGKSEGEACGEGKICDKDLKCVEEESGDVCADEDICAGMTCFIKSDGTAGCSGISCTGGYNDDGTCKGDPLGSEGAVCVDSNDCQSGLSCYEGYCSSGVVVEDYIYVRIDDLSAECVKTGGDCGEDPGADIDAIVLKKGGSADKLEYAATVKAYKRGDGKLASKLDADFATNPERALGAPDSFIHYPTVDGICYYWAKDTTDQRTYVSLGGLGGYLEVQMAGTIEANDLLDVLEMGDCTLWNTTEKPNKEDKKINGNEEIRVQISISGEDGAWKVVGNGKATKGIISFAITGL